MLASAKQLIRFFTKLVTSRKQYNWIVPICLWEYITEDMFAVMFAFLDVPVLRLALTTIKLHQTK
jgi:hypothetical protein